MIDHFHSDPSRPGLVEGPGSITIQTLPRLLVYLRLESRPQGLLWIILAKEVGLADKEAFAVVVSVNKPARDAFSTIAAHVA